MKLSDIKTLRDIAEETGIAIETLRDRLKLKSFHLIEDVDYRRLGKGQSIILTPEGVKKITKK